MKKIAFIVPYFGKLRPWFEIWLKTASENKTIDFFIFTDNKPELFSECGKNIKLVFLTFEQCRHMIQEKYPFQIALNTPYKLCDFKPAYGEIFQDYLGEYDFWGYCDTDMVLGDLRQFLTESILDGFDRIQSWGPFALFRNDEQMRTHYRQQGVYPEPNYQQVFASDEVFIFDEHLGVYLKTLRAGVRLYDEIRHKDPEVKKFIFSMGKNGTQFVLEWISGKLYSVDINDRKRSEICYSHFYKRDFIFREEGSENKFSVYPNVITLGAGLKEEAFSIKNQPLYPIKYWLRRCYVGIKLYIHSPFKFLRRKRWMHDCKKMEKRLLSGDISG